MFWLEIFFTTYFFYIMTKKLLYTAPEAEALVIQAEGGIMIVSGGDLGEPQAPGAVFDPGDIFDGGLI